ncbi:hypothetical protein CC80DRAFT_551128 [Byssothecium circinans]|uniref:Uncharacterized protein n=1 Tax=Byssothecium circinans TaxID=147558 RepID=A0A6A5TP31_9PLEO|nr:hypothetical protein CC80DRAFT_551128 [Byssothecium circinans]
MSSTGKRKWGDDELQDGEADASPTFGNTPKRARTTSAGEVSEPSTLNAAPLYPGSGSSPLSTLVDYPSDSSTGSYSLQHGEDCETPDSSAVSSQPGHSYLTPSRSILASPGDRAHRHRCSVSFAGDPSPSISDAHDALASVTSVPPAAPNTPVRPTNLSQSPMPAALFFDDEQLESFKRWKFRQSNQFLTEEKCSTVAGALEYDDFERWRRDGDTAPPPAPPPASAPGCDIGQHDPSLPVRLTAVVCSHPFHPFYNAFIQKLPATSVPSRCAVCTVKTYHRFVDVLMGIWRECGGPWDRSRAAGWQYQVCRKAYHGTKMLFGNITSSYNHWAGEERKWEEANPEVEVGEVRMCNARQAVVVIQSRNDAPSGWTGDDEDYDDAEMEYDEEELYREEGEDSEEEYEDELDDGELGYEDGEIEEAAERLVYEEKVIEKTDDEADDHRITDEEVG